MRLIDADELVHMLGTDFDTLYETIFDTIRRAPTIDAVPVVRCKDCLYYDCPHVENDGKRYEYAEMPKEAFDELRTGLVTIEYGINVGGRCCVDYIKGRTDKRIFRRTDDYCSRGERKDP